MQTYSAEPKLDPRDRQARAQARVTREMVRAGVRALAQSDYGAPIRFQTDAELVTVIFMAMAEYMLAPSAPPPRNTSRSEP
jgi:hypothetical protein